MNCTICPINNATTSLQNQSADGRQGWTSSPNGRGTFDIVWNCVVTMFLCCWSVLVVNVPDSRTSTSQLLIRKLFLVALSIVAPEIIFQMALGQWLSARRSVKLFHDAGYPEWTISHGFYADMGGFHLKPSNWNAFPINAEQLLYLITKNHVQYPKVSNDHIRDKNKVDGMLRIIALIQTLWFLLNIVFRATEQLAITALELSTAAFVLLNFSTTLCWMGKPADVETPDLLACEKKIEEIISDSEREGATSHYYNTPLDFVGRHEWSWSIMWAHGLNVLRRLNLAAPPVERPVKRFQNTVVPEIEGAPYVLFMTVTVLYFAIFLLGWNFSFPTRTEDILWRAATLTALSSVLGFLITMHISFSWGSALKLKIKSVKVQIRQPSAMAANGSTSTPVIEISPQKKRSIVSKFAACIRNNSILKDPALDAPLFAIVATYILGFFYCSSRAYIVVADIMELRSLPQSAYQDVDWSAYWPHL